MREILLLRITGPDQGGLTATIGEILAQHQVNILDVGQSVIHEYVSLGMLVELPQNTEAASVLKELLYRAHSLGVSVDFTPVDEASYSHWVNAQGKSRYILTLLAEQISAAQMAAVGRIVADQGLNIDDITRLSGRIPLEANDHGNSSCVELSVRGEPSDPDLMRQQILQASSELQVDIAFQEDTVYRRHRRLLAFDMDSTLIETEVIDELARAAGVGEQVSEITEAAMRGEMDFKESFRQRMALLEGLDESVLSEIAARLPITPGAEKLISNVRSLGYKTAILSGGFNYFGRFLQQKLGIDYVFANELEIVDGKVTGRVVGDVVDGQRKADLLVSLAQKEGIALQQTVAIGDGANDLPMLSQAGLGIAFRAKPIVRASAKQALSNMGLDGVLYLLGFKDQHLKN